MRGKQCYWGKTTLLFFTDKCLQMLTNSRFIPLGKALLSCILLLVLVRAISWSSLSAALAQAYLEWFLFACLAAIGVLIVSAWRWQFLLKSLGVESPTLAALVYYYFLSSFFNNFAPANLAGDSIRASALYHHGQSPVVATSSVVLERLLSFSTLCGLCIWALIAQPLPLAISVPIYAVYAIGSGLLVVFVLGVWLRGHPLSLHQHLVTQIREMWRTARQHPYELIQGLSTTILLHIVTMLITYGTLRAVSVQFGLQTHLAVYAIAGLAIALPISVQGIGVREGIYLGLLGIIRIAPERVLAAMALNYIILIFLSIAGGILFWIGPRTLMRGRGSTQ
jgi:uncharacterized membrane protein YbhN (UPF0104 family)